MKKNKTICLDSELMDRLAEESNASGLIEELLTDHYQHVRPEGQSDKDRKAWLLKSMAKDKLKQKHEKELKKYDGY